jgi:hypothetical protein
MEAVEAAKQGLEKLGLQTNARMVSALVDAHPGTPLFVKRLDKDNQGYYLVPWVSQAGVSLVVQVNATTGAIASVIPLPVALPHIAITSEEAGTAVSEKLGRQARGAPQLAWRPCRESSSPFSPFYKIETDEGEVYVGMDAQVHTTLTPFEKGGG